MLSTERRMYTQLHQERTGVTNKMASDISNDKRLTNRVISIPQESYSILSSVEERRMYDWSLARSENPERYAWPFEADITQTPTQPPPPQVLRAPRSIFDFTVTGELFSSWSAFQLAMFLFCLCFLSRSRRMLGQRGWWDTSCSVGWSCPSHYRSPSIDKVLINVVCIPMRSKRSVILFQT